MKRGRNKTLEMAKRIEAIETEFDESLISVVVGMREQNNSWKTIAGALEVHPHTLLKWRRRFGFCELDEHRKIWHSSREGTFLDRIARKHRYINFEQMYRDMRLKKKMTVAQMAAAIGVNPATISKWTPEELKGHRIITKKAAQASARNLELARRNRNTPWQAGMDFRKASGMSSLLAHKDEIEAVINAPIDTRPFIIVDAQANVLIECACGDVLSFGGSLKEIQCDSCTRRYRIKLTVTEITHEEEQSIII